MKQTNAVTLSLTLLTCSLSGCFSGCVKVESVYKSNGNHFGTVCLCLVIYELRCQENVNFGDKRREGVSRPTFVFVLPFIGIFFVSGVIKQMSWNRVDGKKTVLPTVDEFVQWKWLGI